MQMFSSLKFPLRTASAVHCTSMYICFSIFSVFHFSLVFDSFFTIFRSNVVSSQSTVLFQVYFFFLLIDFFLNVLPIIKGNLLKSLIIVLLSFSPFCSVNICFVSYCLATIFAIKPILSDISIST